MAIPESARTAWIGPIPDPPPCRIGDVLPCEIHGDIRVTGWHDSGSVQWPAGRPVGAGRGGRLLVVTPALADAVRTESETAIMRWLNVAKDTVRRWRRELSVERHNAGTRQLRQAETGDADRRRLANKSHPLKWSAGELAILGTMTDEAAAERTGRTLDAVRSKRVRLGIAANNKRRRGRPPMQG